MSELTDIADRYEAEGQTTHVALIQDFAKVARAVAGPSPVDPAKAAADVEAARAALAEAEGKLASASAESGVPPAPAPADAPSGGEPA